MGGFVSLVGAGPGNPELLTILAKRRLSEADVVVYDRLVNPALMAPLAAEKIDVGKLPQHHKVSQYQINDLLVEQARKGKRVVRLKSGDPYVFGRGGEEGQYLRQQRVAFEVVPGITSAIAGLGAAGIPITHRDFASSFHVITGHHKADGTQLDWENIARQEGTLVFLMGMGELGHIAEQLIKNGRASSTPVAVIQWATHWNQRSVKADLGTIETVVETHHIGSPALIVVGNVVSLMDELNPELPLQGLHLLIPFKDPSKLFSKLQDQGAAVNFFKRRTQVPLTFDLPDMLKGGTLVISDQTAFDFFEHRLLDTGYDQRVLSKWRVLALNQAIAGHLKRHGLLVDGYFESDNSLFSELEIVIGEETALGHFKEVKSQKIATYRAIPVNQTIEVGCFHGIVFPSSASVDDLVSGCRDSQKRQLASMPCFAMGKQVVARCQASGIRNIISVNPSIDAVMPAIQSYFKCRSVI
ncbi:MAG: uroporphyrinogen-III C-methyltransferase [Lentilactobacillus hilgardii]|uniref:uroporphyrinogen-III C-methyltransferase n=1 Tax=Lentilactobacillus hilgardii TaxID=1588 RepID=UPI001CC1C784|nr:uroporphyrinogen-III C-methyltransferase [Lentilactobacillus hilgardii]MBZ2200356.1 uroporphyrinogen-III C-methyltransferase [Lentilactobacillus hilgardii]MBZ2203564.1 uroporphyrinogen-III C-methyltransferase [Lentilactobacillus hilgardii]